VEEYQQTQHILDLPKVAAGAVASPLAAILTSRFGVAGTMIGLALSAVIVTVVVDTLKVYLARVPGAVTKIPGGFKKKSPARRLLIRLRLPFSKLSSLSPERRGYILGRSVIAGVIVFLIGLVVVTGLELGVGKNLSCWVWNDCASASPADGGTASKTSNTYTLPSILGGGASTSSNAPQEVGPANPKQPAPPVTPGTLSQPPNTPGSGRPDPSAQSGRQQNPSEPSDEQSRSPSGASESQQQSPSGTTSDDQPQSSPSETPDDQSLQSPSGSSDDQSRSPSETPGNQPQSPSNNSGEGDQQETPSSSSSTSPQGSADQQQAPSPLTGLAA
jgi:hypothetical protein